MSMFDYRQSANLVALEPTFDALVMAAIRKADTVNAARLRSAFPDIYAELVARYNAPGGILEHEL